MVMNRTVPESLLVRGPRASPARPPGCGRSSASAARARALADRDAGCTPRSATRGGQRADLDRSGLRARRRVARDLREIAEVLVPAIAAGEVTPITSALR